ncbi:hypothetical protein DFH08DRAFT_761150 [Mycena albidolilacea]|uniref:Translation initiation factor 3 N-terminal domain-containing protein n=1 Tax=Mycena albidolilacea TaxID=1033008 RepID=A0AAD7ATU4_9AGAR|nr:hypothetical protein DFH08DRAFT_761150 [Mycena albidolilacea]
MNTFSAFRFAARTLLHPSRHPAHLTCLDPVALHPAHVRFKSQAFRAHNRLRDEKIPYVEVSVVEEDNTLVKTSLRRLLRSIDRTESWIELVSEDPEPVVKIINKKAAVEIQRRLKKQRRESARHNIMKEVQLTWGSEPGDLEHKLARVRAYLEMGAKVDIVYAIKPNAVPPSVAVQQEKVQNTIDSLADIAKEWRPVEWRKNIATIFFQGDSKLKPVEEEGPEVVENEGEGHPVTAPPPPAAAAPRPAGRPRDYVDLSEFGFIKPPVRRDPTAGQKPVKKYGTRKSE